MSNSLKRILNPSDEEILNGDIQHVNISGSPEVYQSNEQLMGNNSFDFINGNNFAYGNLPFEDYNGELPRPSQYLGPSMFNPSSELPIMGGGEQLQSVYSDMSFSFDIEPELFSQLDINSLPMSDVAYLDPSLNNTSESVDAPSESFGTTPQSYSSSALSQGEGFMSSTPSTESDSGPTSDDSVSSPMVDDSVTICYGMLHNVEVKLIGDMAPIMAKLDQPGSAYQYFKLTEQQDHAMLKFQEEDMEFGYLRSGPAKTLLHLMSQPSVAFEPIASKYNLKEIIHRANKPNEAMIKVDINIYGNSTQSLMVGKILSEGKLWLQRSDHSKNGSVYENPHLLKIDIPEMEAMPLELSEQTAKDGAPKKRTREEQLRKMVEEVYKSVDNNRELEMVDGGSRVVRKLLQHQQQALGFMLERESGNINDRYRLWQEVTLEDGRDEYRHRITKARRATKPEEKGGGILADEMGMGKSLSILALVMKTLEDGQDWANQQKEEHKGKRSVRYSRSTLIVVSSALLIANWQEEIQTHLQRGLSVIKYHGSGRVKRLRSLQDSDIVITTYNTLAAEFQTKPSVLHQIGWYRVVLDEAHFIRCPTTSFFKSCHSLQANSRWCLTGTPIQNKLADIGTLFTFIRAEPFDKAAVFRKWIEVAYEHTSDDPERVKERLVLLLEALCLRRTKDVLPLPGVEEQIRTLEFSQDEQDQYEKTHKTLIRTIRGRVGEVEKSSKFGLFQMKLQLRIFCNHGTFQKPNSWKRRSLLNEKEAVIGSYGTDGEIRCCVCGQEMPVLGSDFTRRIAEGRCGHLLCSECEVNSNTAGSRDSQQQNRCPICIEWNQEPAEDNHAHYFNPKGYSTKMTALIEDVQKDLSSTKSIIFSCWTRTLYQVGKHLDQAKIPHLKIDGECPLAKRKSILDQFKQDEDMPVLIMTTGTGAFGLNLTCANRIFIVELQWNPSVENQAIARAIRLGQERQVYVTRYVIKGTVEEDMQMQQQYKKVIADIGFQGLPDSMDTDTGEE